MITKDQLTTLANKLKINESVIFREYLQIYFLATLYSFPKSKDIFFRGGTAIHLIYRAPRFSENLDFTSNLNRSEFMPFIKEIFNKMEKEENVAFKERKTITGKRFLLTANPTVLPYRTFINLDFSFREKIIDPQKSILETQYPVLFTSYIYHLSKEEIFAEKIRAMLTRKKGRDLYDMWYLFSLGVDVKDELVKEKLKYYGLERKGKENIQKRLDQFSPDDFILDIRPFIPVSERDKLKDFFMYIKDYLKKKFV